MHHICTKLLRLNRNRTEGEDEQSVVTPRVMAQGECALFELLIVHNLQTVRIPRHAFISISNVDFSQGAEVTQ